MLLSRDISIAIRLFLLLLIVTTVSSCNLGNMSNDIIAENASYTVTNDSVTMGRYTASATDDRNIITNYRSSSIDKIPNILKFRLTVGSRDIELLPAQYHYIDLDNAEDSIQVKAFVPDSVKKKSSHNCPVPSSLKLCIDMSEVKKSFKERNYFVTPSRDTIYAQDFNDALLELHFIIGEPAISFKTRINNDWQDNNMCNVSLDLKTILSHQFRTYNNWTLKDETIFDTLPQYTSKQPILNALYNMSLEQIMAEDSNQYSSLIAGECYFIALSLAYLQPKESMERLRAMVGQDGIINTEFGTKTYASLNNDLMWAHAAWSVYCSTGNKEWLKYSYEVILKNIEQAKKLTRSAVNSLYNSMCPYLSSYTSQYYPSWMSPSDAYESTPLVGNIIMEHGYRILGQIADEFEMDIDYDTEADRIKDAINHRLWSEAKKSYTQYLYGGVTPVMSPVIDNMGQALSVLWDIADDDRAERLIKETPITNYGVPLLYPSRVNTGTGLNNTVIPMVQAIWNLAAAKTDNMSMLRRGMGALIFQQALSASCATSCDATTGNLLTGNNPRGNAAGNIAMVLRVIAGLNFLPNGIEMNPRVPVCFDGNKTIKNLKYRDANLTITIKGTGDDWSKITLDGKELDYNFIDGSLKGEHKIVITMNGKYAGSGKVTEAQTIPLLPEEPQWKWDGYYGTNYSYSNALGYKILINGEPTYPMRDSVLGTRDTVTYRNYSIVAINKYGQSFISRPHYITTIAQIYKLGNRTSQSSLPVDLPRSFEHSLYEIPNDSSWISIPVHTQEAGDYILDVMYSNGNGAPSLWSPCDMLEFSANGHDQGVVITPPLGMNQWCGLQYSSHLLVKLLKGNNTIKLRRIRPGGVIGDDYLLLEHMRLIKS